MLTRERNVTVTHVPLPRDNQGPFTVKLHPSRVVLGVIEGPDGKFYLLVEQPIGDKYEDNSTFKIVEAGDSVKLTGREEFLGTYATPRRFYVYGIKEGESMGGAL